MVGGLASRAYRLTRHRLLRNTATDPVTGYLVRISVDRDAVDPDLGGEEQGRVLCLPTTSASWANPIEAPFGPLRNFVMSGSERPNHTVLSEAPGLPAVAHAVDSQPGEFVDAQGAAAGGFGREAEAEELDKRGRAVAFSGCEIEKCGGAVGA
ncbi:hypothetical protein [Streptomyces sp. NPDC093544]|uniref:hypothetical protein n=1 Tax=Streptomyces sp. NPDC093544 TaxID=3155200 RepID=UPI00342A515C